MDNLAARLAQVAEATERGEWLRHVSAAHVGHALEGRDHDGRWGTRDSFPVLYLGKPRDSVIVEAYRHIVDPLEFDDPADRQAFIATLVPRTLVTCSVDVTNLLDLRTAFGRAQAGLTLQDLRSSTNNREAYARCQLVAQVAHQIRRHGMITPAATDMGETLALFTDMLPTAQRPVRCREDEPWQRLPSDPRDQEVRHLRVVRQDE